jgi:hypothetical protein
MPSTKSIATTFLVVLICLSTACTTMRPITADASGEQVRLELNTGDTVHVLTKSGASHSFQVTAIGATSLVGNAVKMSGGGSDAVGARIDIPYADIAQIDVRRVNGLKTTGVIVTVLLAATVAIATGGGSHTPGYSR